MLKIIIAEKLRPLTQCRATFEYVNNMQIVPYRNTVNSPYYVDYLLQMWA